MNVYRSKTATRRGEGRSTSVGSARPTPATGGFCCKSKTVMHAFEETRAGVSLPRVDARRSKRRRGTHEEISR